MIDVTQIIIAVLTLVFSLIARFLIPYIKNKTDAEQFKTIKWWVGIAVEAAEMIYSGSGRGAEKKEYVVEFLKSQGLSVDADKIENLIESAVLELKQCTVN